MDAEPVFVDTSLVVAASVKEHPAHQVAVAAMAELDANRTPLCISPQICRETLVVLTRSAIAGRVFTTDEAAAALQEWRSTCVLLHENEETVREWERLLAQYQVRGKAVHDCNVVATMRANGVRRLATRNAPDFARYQAEIDIEAAP
jgi:predicted nucleic acid-binding protein